MKIERRKSRNAEVFTASLNDIMFFLLMFFLIISTMVTPSVVKVTLPEASAAENTTMKKAVHVVVTRDLQYFVDNEEVTFDQIESRLESILAAKQENEELNVILQADKSLTLQDVIDVINIGYKLNVKMVLFAEKNK
ncbi:MAG TPA: biopolymer transporter ExbD [Porphyromonadaceae bacterium]|jgi:biopolymer transport protein ExbD|nr:biopolymer transporter ExbD [Porphyromonadaceae bacterium]HBX19718.1 biopolymer transporter ExbD [Porphyromonadaceae bacterium]HCM22523.1 biopolymer transporter ExbD [Porphyromonadaceae bacterium]